MNFVNQLRSARRTHGVKLYWISSAKKIGLADTTFGIRFFVDPSIPLSAPASLDILARVASSSTITGPLVFPEDKLQIAEFLYLVMMQLQPCRFTEADRNKRRLKDLGCKGVECKHCAGHVDARKFFWSSVNAVESNFVSVHTHMMECKMIPNELKEELARLKVLRKEQTSRLKSGSQKAFFARVWERLHPEGSDEIPSSPRNISPSSPSRSDMRENFAPKPVITPSWGSSRVSPPSFHSWEPMSSIAAYRPKYEQSLGLGVPQIDSIEVEDLLQGRETTAPEVGFDYNYST